MALKKTKGGQYRQQDLDKLTRAQVLTLLKQAEWCTREDLLGLFLAGEHANRPAGLDHVVQPHTPEDLADSEGIVLDLAGIQDDHADAAYYGR